MKRNLALLLAILTVCMLFPLGAHADTYTEAVPSENQEVYPIKTADGQYDLLRNGSFETVSNDRVPVGWIFSHAIQANGAYTMTATGNDAMDGENFAVIHGGTGGRIYLTQTLTTLLPTESYAFCGYFRQLSGTAKPMLCISCQKPSGTSFQTVKTYYYTMTAEESWTKIEYDLFVPAETTRVLFSLRLDGEAEINADKFSLVGEAPENTQIAIDFRDMLQQEKKRRISMEKSYGQGGSGATVSGQPDNILENGTLESENGAFPSGWSQGAYTSYLSVMQGTSYNGSDCLRLFVPAGNGLRHPFCYQIQSMMGGAEYEVSFWYKASGGRAVVKFEYYNDRYLPGAVSCGEWYAGASVSDGEWHYYSGKIYPASNVKDATIALRLLQNSETEDAQVCFDDIRIRMIGAPDPMEFSTSAVFFYTDETEGTASAAVNLDYYPALSGAYVSFEIWDGETGLWQQSGIALTEGTASASFPLSLLSRHEHPYIARATLTDAGGTALESKVQQIFVYERPTCLGADGIYRKNGGEVFYPLFAYHVSTADYIQAAQAGINLVQMGAFSTADQAVAALDKAQEAGIMGFIALYYGMEPAGHSSNIERTISIVNDSRVKNHPALFGYGIMDEVFANIGNPQMDLENSFRLVRMLDANHPVMAMEAIRTYYGETAKYTDILCIDPYSAASVQNAFRSTEDARQAVHYKKPVYSLLETYYTTHGRWPSPEDGRNNNYQALLAGASAVGYFTVSDADKGTDGEAIPIWDARDGGALWAALCTFGETEKEMAYAHFVCGNTPVFNQSIGGDCWYHSFTDGLDIYVLILGTKENQEKTVAVPLVSMAGDIRIGAFSAALIAGENTQQITGNGTLSVTVQGVQALLYKVTPTETTDFSALGASCIEDMQSYPWAWQQAAKLDSLAILEGKSKWEFAPDTYISGSEFAQALGRILPVNVQSALASLTPRDAISLIRDALSQTNRFGESNTASYLTADAAATLHKMLLRGGAALSAQMTRAEAAVLLERVYALCTHPEKLQEIAGIFCEEAAGIETVMLENGGVQSGDAWYQTVGEYVYIQNAGDIAASVTVPKGGQYVKILCGAANEDISLSADQVSVQIGAGKTVVLRITDTVQAGLAVGNCVEVHPRANVTYTAYGLVGVYTDIGGIRQLKRLFLNGQSAAIPADLYVRGFWWDETMQPIG